MASRDILVLNTTASRAETQQGSDTVAIRGDSSKILSVENSSGTSVLSVDSYSSSIELTGDITASGNISSSLSSTASIGRLEATTLIGSAFNLTGTAIENTVSSSAQIAPYISGSFRRGFEFTGTIGDQPGGLDNKITASFGRIVAVTLSGSAANLTNTTLDNTISSSKQIASQISGAFTSGFNFDGKISGSVASTGSFARIDAITLAGDGTELTNIAITDTISGSAQIASQISGAFNNGFEFTGIIGKLKSWSFGTPMSNGAQEMVAWGTKNCVLVASGYLENPAGIVTENSTEEWNGSSWAYGGDIITARTCAAAFGISTEAAFMAGGSTSDSEEYNGSAWSEANDLIAGRKGLGGTGTSEAGIVAGGQAPNHFNTELFNGTNWSEENNLITGIPTVGRMVGTQTSALIKMIESGNKCTQEWNGTNWTEIADSNTARYVGGGFAGSVNDAWLAGGHPSTPATTEEWNGTSWSDLPSSANLNCIRKHSFGVGLPSVGMQIGGQTNTGPPNYAACSPYADRVVEEFTHFETTGSFGRVEATTITGDISNMTGVGRQNMISGSAQIASRISGSFNKGFTFDGKISGSATSTGSFGRFVASKMVGDITGMTNIIPRGTISGSAQIASRVSGAFDHGFEFVGTISASAGNTNTGSFNHLVATTITGDVSGMTGADKPGFISSSAQIASRISGSFNRGFQFSGSIFSNLGAFSAGGALIVAKRNTAGIGTKAGALVVGGDTNPDPAAAHLGTTEEYNGTNFSEVNDLITPRRCTMGAGTTEAGIIMGGQKFPSPGTIACTEVYNGSSWSEEADMNYCTKGSGDAGDTSEAAIVFGGNYNTPASHYTAQSEEYNGTTWSEITSLIKARTDLAGFGNSEAALAVAGSPAPGGHMPGNGFDVEEWNGSNWTAVAPTLTNPYLNAHIKGAGTVNDGHAFGGFYQCYVHPGPITYHYDGRSQHWDGSAWTHGGGLITGRRSGGGDGTSGDNGFYVSGDIGGNAPYTSTCMEVYSRIFTTGSFGRLEVKCLSGNISNMTNINPPTILTGSSQIAANISGSFNKGFTFEGTIQNEPYTFTEVAALNTGRQALGASGIKTAGLVFGGYAHPTQVGSTETFNGSAWSEVNDMIAAGRGIGGSGTSTATVAFGGHPTRNQYTEEWNGTNWSEVNDMIRSDFACQAADIGQSSEAAIAAGSCTQYTINDSTGLCNEEWNGTNWATAGALIHQASQTGGGAGTANAGITAGGHILPGYPGAHRCTQLWNGSNWSESEAALPPSNHRGILYGWGGSQNDAIITGGCSYQGALFDTSYCYNGLSWSAGSAIGTLSGQNAAGVYRHKGAGTTVDNSFFAGGVAGGAGGNSGAANAFCTDNGVASGSFTHIQATRISGSVDGMTNISEPVGTVSGSAQIASQISGSFNKGFEFTGEIESKGVWSSGGTFPGAVKHNYHGGVWGTQNSALLGGGIGIYQAGVCDTYSYNGTSWSDTGANMIDSKGGYTAHGTENAALAAGGVQYKSHIFQYLRINTEEWNGSAWSATTNLPHQLAFLNNQKGGTQNASLIAGGYTGTGGANVGSGSEAFQRTNVTWDGLSYTVGASMANERGSGGFVGTVNTGLAQGSNNGLGASTCTEEWNGTAWSDAAASNFQTAFTQTVGTTNDAMHTTDANSPVRTGCTDFYNGVSWSIGPLVGLSNSSCPKQCAGSAGSTSAGLFMTYGNSCVEHFDAFNTTASLGTVETPNLSIDKGMEVKESFQLPVFAANPEVTSSAGEVWYNRDEQKLYFTYDINSWTELADTNTARNELAGLFGTTGAALHFGGSIPATADTEEWNGTTWTEVNNLNEAKRQPVGVGVVNAGLAAGGGTPSYTGNTEEWNGTNWTEVADLNTARMGGGHAGTQNASIYFGGYDPTKADSEEWNGTAWTEGNNLITGRQHGGFNGTQNTAWVAGGNTPSNASTVEHYNGTSWSSQTALPAAHGGLAGAGSQTAGIVFGGMSSPYIALEWNGQSWTSVDNMNSNHARWNGDGTQASALAVGQSGVTEAYTTTGIGCACIGGV